MEYTAQQAAEAARNIGVDLEGEKIRPEALAAGMAVEAARHGTKDAATNIVAEDPVIAAKLALANLRVSPNYYSPKAGVTAWEKSLARGAKQQGRKTEYKTLLFNVDDYDEEQGIFSGYGSVFGNVDDGGDIVEPGAFTKTIAEGFERVKILALHNDSLLPIGRPLEVREDSKGLYIKAKISDTAMGRDVKVLLKDGVLNELSIGYDPIVFDYDETGIRHLREVKLWEVSVVTWAMNPEATVIGYKAAETADRAVKLTEDAAAEVKEGRKISSARLKTLKEASETMKKAAKTLDALISEVEGEKAIHHLRNRGGIAMFKYAKPTIPLGLLHDIEELEPGGSYDQANGGQWKPTKPTSKTFKGVVMPVNNEDLQYAIAGTYTQNSQKLYTNGHSLTVGQQVRDTFDGQVYTVKQELTHGPIHPLKRYVVEKKGVSSPK